MNENKKYEPRYKLNDVVVFKQKKAKSKEDYNIDDFDIEPHIIISIFEDTHANEREGEPGNYNEYTIKSLFNGLTTTIYQFQIEPYEKAKIYLITSLEERLKILENLQDKIGTKGKFEIGDIVIYKKEYTLPFYGVVKRHENSIEPFSVIEVIKKPGLMTTYKIKNMFRDDVITSALQIELEFLDYIKKNELIRSLTKRIDIAKSL